MIVLDASAAVEWLLVLPLADAVTARLAPEDQTVHAPHLLAVEVALDAPPDHQGDIGNELGGGATG